MLNRPAAEADLDAVRRLACGFDGVPATPPDEAFRARFSRILRDEGWALLVADDGGELVGYALVQDYGAGLRRDLSPGRLHDLYVAEHRRRQRVGRLLMGAVTAWCRSRGTPAILDWQSRADAVPFYESLGLAPDHAGDTATYPAFSLDLR